jgi:hypothetical protein
MPPDQQIQSGSTKRFRGNHHTGVLTTWIYNSLEEFRDHSQGLAGDRKLSCPQAQVGDIPLIEPFLFQAAKSVQGPAQTQLARLRARWIGKLQIAQEVVGGYGIDAMESIGHGEERVVGR